MQLLSEDRQTLTELAKHENVNVSTAWRWANRGVKNVRLETFRVGGRRYTTKQAFARFVEATNAASEGHRAPRRTCRQREQAIERAEREATDLGL